MCAHLERVRCVRYAIVVLVTFIAGARWYRIVRLHVYEIRNISEHPVWLGISSGHAGSQAGWQAGEAFCILRIHDLTIVLIILRFMDSMLLGYRL